MKISSQIACPNKAAQII